MSIVRAPRPTTGFTLVSNSTLQDERLSYRARGILAAILSRPDGWETNSATLAKQGREGRDAIRVALTELEHAGYLRRETLRGEGGQFVTRVTVYDSPAPENPASADQHMATSPAPENPASESQAPKREGETEGKNEDTPANASAGAFFDDFWTAYPRHIGKAAARRKFLSVCSGKSKTDPAAVVAGAQRFAVLIQKSKTEERFVPHPTTWLNAGRWEDETPEVQPDPDRPKPARMPAELLGDFAAQERWHEEQIRARRAGVSR